MIKSIDHRFSSTRKFELFRQCFNKETIVIAMYNQRKSDI
jgi:hypothetical protein